MINIGWIDFSSDDRKKVKQLLTLIKPEGQLDELGIGYIRDAISNKLFPGISTIQTRAKYFFIVPSILKDYSYLPTKEKKRNNTRKFLSKSEDEVQDIFKEKYNGTVTKGIIGFTMEKGKYVKRKPSEIYWNGLKTFSFLETNGQSIKELLGNVDKQTKYLIDRYNGEEESDDFDVAIDNTFGSNIPYHSTWKTDLQIELTQEESLFFVQKLENKNNQYLKNSLIFELFACSELMDLFIMPNQPNISNNFHEFAQLAQSLTINEEVKSTLAVGHNFYVLMESCHLLYNHLLHQHFFIDYQDEYLNQFEDWMDSFKRNMIDFATFRLSELFKLTKYRNYNRTEVFVKDWWHLVQKYIDDRNYETFERMQQLIRQREQLVKQSKARLQKSKFNNPDVKKNQRIGIIDMNYRFYNAQTIINDILNPRTDV